MIANDISLYLDGVLIGTAKDVEIDFTERSKNWNNVFDVLPNTIMTITEIMELIDAQPKPYAGIMKASSYYMIKRRFLDKTIKLTTLFNFLEKYGFKVVDCMGIKT